MKPTPVWDKLGVTSGREPEKRLYRSHQGQAPTIIWSGGITGSQEKPIQTYFEVVEILKREQEASEEAIEQ